MHKAQQATIVNDLLERLKADILTKVRDGAVPEHWDGIELRQYIVDKALENVIIGTSMSRTRLRSYRNDVVVHNL